MRVTTELIVLAALWLVLAAIVGTNLYGGGDVGLALLAWCGGVVSALIVVELRRP